MSHITDNHDALLDYLYEEGDPAGRLKVAKHLQECAPCAVAVLEFQNVRGMLRNWTPPASSRLAAPVTSPDTSVPAAAMSNDHPARNDRPWRSRALLQAAAAVLVFASGMAVSQLHFDYRDGALTVRTKSSAPAPAVRNASIVLPAQNASAGVPASSIDQLEQELRKRLQLQPLNAAATEELLQRVRSMIDQSEQRQQRELALRLSQVAREVDTQHQADLLRIQQDFGKQQEATMEYLVRTSGGAK